MAQCECNKEPLSPAQRKFYDSKLLAFNKNSLQIKRFLTHRNATLIGLNKNAYLYKLEGKCMPQDYNGSFKVIDLDDWERRTYPLTSHNKISADSAPQTYTNLINRSPKISPTNESKSSTGNFCHITARSQLSDPNCIIKEARKLQSIENQNLTKDETPIGGKFNLLQYPVVNSKKQFTKQEQSRKESHNQSLPVDFEGDKSQHAPTIQFVKSQSIAVKCRSPTTNLINNDHQDDVSNSISDPIIDITVEVDETCTEEETSNPVSHDCSSENINKSNEMGEPSVNRKLDKTQAKVQLITKRIIPSHEGNSAIASIIDSSQQPSSINGKRHRPIQIPSLKILPINRFHSISHSSSHLLDLAGSNRKSSLQTYNQINKPKASINLRRDLSGNSLSNCSVYSYKTKSSFPPVMVNSKAPASIDLVLSESEEDRDDPLLDKPKESASQEVNMEQCIEEVRRVIRDHLEYKANNKSHFEEKTHVVRNEEDFDNRKKSTSDKQQEKVHNYKNMDSSGGNLLMNEDSSKISMNDQISNHIVDKNQTLPDKYVVDEAGKVMSSIHLKRIILSNLQKCTVDKTFTVQDIINPINNDSIQNYNEESSEIGENMSDKLGSNFKAKLPRLQGLHDGETVFLWNLINDLLSTNGLQFISKIYHLGLISGHQKCTSFLKHNDRSMKLIQVQNERFGIGVLWSCNHCQMKVSVFHGSIFEGTKLSPSIIIRIIYYWCIQTHIKWIMSKESLHYNIVYELYTRFRVVCTAALKRQIPTKLGGDRREVQVSYIDIFMHGRLIVIGALETEKNLMILKVISVPSHQNYRTKIISLILNGLSTMVQTDSEIVIDHRFYIEHQLKSFYPSAKKVQGEDVITLPITTFLNKIPVVLKNKYSESEKKSLEGIQLILNELVWRRQCNYSAVKMFHTFIEHLSVWNTINDSQELNTVSPLFELKINDKQNSESIDSLQNIEPKVDDKLEVTEPACSRLDGGESSSNQNEELFRIDVYDNEKDINDINLKSKDESLIIIDDDVDDIKSESRCEYSMIIDDDGDDINSESRGESSMIIDDNGDDASQKSIQGDNYDKIFSSKSEMVTSLNEYYYGVINNSTINVSIITKYPMMNCALCSATVTDNIDMMRHLFLHALYKDESSSAIDKCKNYCRHCLFTSKGRLAMANHEVRCNSKPKSQTTCLICLASFESQDKLLSHMQQNHVQTEIPFNCKVCGFRISEYRYIIDHFYKMHKGDKHIQCPFCLQVFTIISGTKLDQRVCIHFYNHVKKHLLIGVNRYCYKCCLSFITDRLLDEHKKRDHISCRKKAVKYTASGPDLDHASSDLFITKQRQSDSEREYKFDYLPLKLNDLPFKAKCVECQGLLSVRNHLPGHFQCESCAYSTHCTIAIHNHIADYHNTKRSPGWRGIVLSMPMICKCGFVSCLGDKIAEHLVFCGKTTAY